ncbi:hypothetical protein KKG22_06025 [Patescibacteria group bacterium]|nr:hypothetical protein [Patescibacteria group bacterium]
MELVMTNTPDAIIPVDEEKKVLSPEEQTRHQTWHDPARLSIQIDCPPGEPRPPEVFASTIKDTGLTPEDFEDEGLTVFGCREYLVKADHDSISRYIHARSTIGEHLKMMHERGIVRGTTC